MPTTPQGLDHDPFCPLVSSPAPLFSSPAAGKTESQEHSLISLSALSETKRSSSLSSLGTLSADRSLQPYSPIRGFENQAKSSPLSMKKSDASAARVVSWSPVQETAQLQILSPDPDAKESEKQQKDNLKIVPVLWKQGETPRGAEASDSVPVLSLSSRTDESVSTTGQLTARSNGRRSSQQSVLEDEILMPHDDTAERMYQDQGSKRQEVSKVSPVKSNQASSSSRDASRDALRLERSQRISERRLKEALASGKQSLLCNKKVLHGDARM